MKVALSLDLELIAARFSVSAGKQVCIAAGDMVSEPSPYLEEQLLVARALDARQKEFYSGRHFARLALLKAGGEASAILRGEKGDPQWPPGFTGSITHDGQRAIAAVARAGEYFGLGIDFLANAASVEPHLQQLIASDRELLVLAKYFPEFPALALAFSLKESVVKAVSPNIDRYLDLLDIHLLSQDGGLIARVLNFELSLDAIGFEQVPAVLTFACYPPS